MNLRTRVLLLASLLLAASAANRTASAGSPDLWEVAAKPRLAQDIRAYREAQRLLVLDSGRGGSDLGVRHQLLLQALRTLERADAVHSPDPRPRFLLGRLLARLAHDQPPDKQQEYLQKAALLLEQTIAEAPEHPEAIDARFSLAAAYAKLHEPRKEIAVYDAILERETSRTDRAVTTMNQAEAFMVLGDLDRSVEGYRHSIGIAPDRPLAHWGLAVALDRNGDLNGAVAEAWAALQYDPNAEELHDDNVFFVPSYDRFWYDALGAMARASHEVVPGLAALWWKDAAGFWRNFLEAASADDRWVPVAQTRRKLCDRKEKQAGLRQLLKRPPQVPVR